MLCKVEVSDDILIKNACIQHIFKTIPYHQTKLLYTHLEQCIKLPQDLQQSQQSTTSKQHNT